jgi:dTDP-4-amino-4,6-dideoxygalactose transaminase
LCLRLKKRGVRTLEDLSHSFLCAIQPSASPVGSCADFAVVSFHDDQWVHCGEGGALLVNASDLKTRVDIHRFRGTDKKSHEPRSAPHYDWLATGGEYSVNELTAAFLLPQLQHRKIIFDRSHRVFNGYRQAIETYNKNGLIRATGINYQSDGCAPHAFFLELANSSTRKFVVEGMKRVGIDCRPYIQPLHTTTMGVRYREQDTPLSRAEELAACTMRLPLYADLAFQDQERIIKLLLRLIDNAASNHH